MGATCCCLRDDWDDFSNLNNSICRNCICLQCFVQNFLYLYASLFHRGEERAIPSSSHGTASLNPRYFRLQRDGLVSRREKGSSHAHEETEPLRSSEVDEESESLSTKSKWNEFTCEEASKEYSSKSSLKFSTAKPATGFAHIYASSEDEDVCPTCLEEYTKENPKILTQCSHHFHLGCIYEWMERSDNCPVCGKVMAFDETT
ncbi:E3 ubiquitin-protein ligase-like protein [Salvia divinorum]|uniref:RING-type E3 ubiquitin transferase n=1 Tax=Salvia divinorum TaxID=28513 RepID=A0ABD1HRW6_SALDI